MPDFAAPDFAIGHLTTGNPQPALNNAAIADKLLELAQFLADHSGNAFRVKAYRRAARTLRTVGESFDELVRTDSDLTHYPGIGNAIASAISEIVRTGTLRQLEALRADATPERAALSEYPHLDAKRILRIFKKLKISGVRELMELLESGELEERTGRRTVQYVRQALAKRPGMLLYQADPAAAAVESFLLDRCRVARADVAGDLRRRVEVVSGLSFVVETRDFASVCRRMGEYGGNAELLAQSAERAELQLPAGIPLQLRRASGENRGTVLLEETGSVKHVRHLKKRCRDWKNFGEEEEVYRACGLDFIEPELREGRDEIALASRGQLPGLIEEADIRGDLHAHTTASDGRNTIGEMAARARARGYEYLGITDHSQSLKIAGGQSEQQLWEQIREIDQWNERLDGIRILKSAEVDILADGSLDYPDDLLRELDYTVCSIHSRFSMGQAEQTERVMRAMDNRYFTILGHATGRLLLKRAGYELDMKLIVRHARANGCCFEINSSPDRLDLSAENARLAAEAGIRIAINTDAHGLRDFDLMRYGIGQARRAGLSRDIILNALRWDQLGPLLASRR